MNQYQRPVDRFEGSRSALAGAPTLASAPHTVHVLIVAPSLMSWGLQRLVQSAGTAFRVVGASLTLAEAMPLLEQCVADVVLIDVDDGYGPEHISELSGRLRAKVLALTCQGDREWLDRILAAGARGIFRKQEAPVHMLKALESVALGERFVSPVQALQVHVAPPPRPSAPPRTPEEDRLSLLTSKERQAVAAVIADAAAPAKVIADRLCISEHTLRNHLTSIYAKLEVSGRLGLQAFISQQQGLLGRLC